MEFIEFKKGIYRLDLESKDFFIGLEIIFNCFFED